MNLRVLPILLLLLCIPGLSRAQEFSFGLHVSPQLSWIDTDASQTEAASKMLFSYGLLAEFSFSDKYAIATGINIQQAGGELNFTDTAGFRALYKGQYIEIPLALKMSTNQNGYLTYFALFGGAVSFKTKETVTFDPERSANELQDSYMAPIGVAFRIGAGLEYEIFGNSALVVGITYNHSLADNLRDEDIRIAKGTAYRFKYVSLTLGFLF